MPEDYKHIDPDPDVETRPNQYSTFQIPAGRNVTVEVRSNGALLGTVGRWRSSAKPGRTAVVQVRVRVTDNVDPLVLRPAVPPVLPPVVPQGGP